MQKEFYVEYKTFPRCKKCNSKMFIKSLNLTLTTECKCEKNNKDKFIHISDLYNKIQFTKELKRVKIGETLQYNNKLRLLISKVLCIMKKIIIIYFNFYSVFFPFVKNNDDLDFDNNSQDEKKFFEEKNSKKFKENILNLNNENLSEKDKTDLKSLLLDMFFYVLFLKKCPYYVETITKNFHNIKYFELNEFNDNTFKLYDEFQEALKQVFCPHYEVNIKIIKVYLISETNTILLFTLNDVIFYNFELNEITFILSQKMIKAKIYKINSQKLLFHHENVLFLMCIKYDSMNRAIKIYKKYFEMNEKKQIKCISSVNVIDENNIVVVDSDINLYLLKKNRDDNYSIDKKTQFKIDFWCRSYHSYTSLYIDKSNERVILFFRCHSERIDSIFEHSAVLIFYDLNFTEKKIMRFTYNDRGCFSSRDLHILNNETYILFFGQKIYLISSKYLEIVSIYDYINMPNLHENILILKQTQNIFIFPYFSNYVSHFRFVDNEIKYIGEKIYSRNLIDIKEINENGDSILFTNAKTGPIFYYFKNDKKISDYNFSLFKETEKNIANNYFIIKKCPYYHYHSDFDYDDDLYWDFKGCTCEDCCPRFANISEEVLDYIELKQEDYYKYKKKKRRINKRKKIVKIRKKNNKKYMVKYGEEDEYFFDIDFFQNKNIIKTYF